MNGWLAPDLGIFDGRHLLSGHAVRRAERGVEIAPAGDVDARPVPGVATAGFIDIQVNGGGGVLLNGRPDRAGIAAIVAAHRSFGTGAMLPTLITDGAGIADTAADAACAMADCPGLLGLHLEGPHIAPARRGTHRADLIRRFDGHTLRLVERLRTRGCHVVVTLAPEAATSKDIRALVDAGARVSLGHSDTDAAGARAAFAAGATGVTHLFNAMSPLQGRAPGLVGAAISSDAYVSVILDGIHVDPLSLDVAIRARPRDDRMILISDAMPTVGGPDSFDLQGQTITRRGARLINRDGNLAGAHTTMAEGVRRAVSALGMSLETALRMAITHPAAFLGVDVTPSKPISGFMLFMPESGDIAWIAPPA